MNSHADDNNELGCIMSARKQLLVNRFQNSHVEFNKRQANGVTHELAQTTLSNPSPHVIDDLPLCILPNLANEMQ